MGVASLGGLSPVGACGAEDAPPADAAAAAGSVDFAGALYHFGHAQEMLDRLREEAAEQGEPNAQVRRFYYILSPAAQMDDFLIHLMFFSLQFLYQEQYDLVQQHQRLIAAHASGAQGQGAGGAAPVDEEWGDEDEEEESGDMVVDK